MFSITLIAATNDDESGRVLTVRSTVRFLNLALMSKVDVFLALSEPFV